MAWTLKHGFHVSCLGEVITSNASKTEGNSGFCPSHSLPSDFIGRNKNLVVSHQQGFSEWNMKSPSKFSVHAQAATGVSRGLRWWEKSVGANMVEINCAQELVDALRGAGDRLVVVDFYSPGCGGCRALHPKICQLAGSNPDAIFLKVNYEKMRTLCHSLHIHVLPFFRFYRGSEGRLCSFSCTNATIKKFKDALAKHGSEGCGIGPAKGLDDCEVMKLAALGEISLPTKEYEVGDLVIKTNDGSRRILC